MAPTFCNRCGNHAVEEGCDVWDEIVELDTLLGRLRLKRYDLKRKINRFHSPIVCQLPPDVTAIIFEFCLPDFTDYQMDRLSAVSPFTCFTKLKEDLSIPLSLGAICSYWREIAWSTPSLWSSLFIHAPGVRDSSSSSHTMPSGIAREWLARSGQLPLSIRILHILVTFEHSQHWSISLINILPVGPILTSICLSVTIDIFMQPPLYSNPFDSNAQTMRRTWMSWTFS